MVKHNVVPFPFNVMRRRNARIRTLTNFVLETGGEDELFQFFLSGIVVYSASSILKPFSSHQVYQHLPYIYVVNMKCTI